MPKIFKQPSYVESLADELLSKYRRLDSILSHAPSKGSYHESILRDVIRRHLPSTFSTGEGFVLSGEGKISSQIDILIVDNLDPRSFSYKENDFYIASDIAVACIGEVKTYCTKSEFIDAFNKLVDGLILIPDSGRVTSFLFCYDAHASEETFIKWLDEAMKIASNKKDAKVWHYPDYVFCLKKKVIMERRVAEKGDLVRSQYWNITSKNPNSNIVEQIIISDLFQCIINGCGRLREIQGIKLLRK